ncbi:MAG: ral secretion pathway protein [Sphingomonas bacterium]|nr:XrtA/PEP-CTERM system-associated ATPase [Sphingomonas bacterium]MDB5689887.1 ral secretion pathway protein [Sphingomonas bacterium]
MYETYYGFSAKPFRLRPDPHFFYGSKGHKRAMAYLDYGLSQGEGFIVITGDVGAGKTTLVGHLMASVDPQRLNAIRLLSTQVGDEDILRLTAQQLGLATEGLAKAQLIERIERTLRLHANEGRQTLLIVDEAQNLPLSALEELRMLSNCQAAGSALVQIVLLGQPEFREKIQTSPDLEQLRQRIIATHHLDPMAEDEIEPYLIHRLKLVGWAGRPRFTAEAIAAMYDHTRGLPRRLNTLATRALLHSAIEKLEEIDAAAIDAAQADLAADGQGGPARPGPASDVADEFAPIDRARSGLADRRPAAAPAAADDPALLRRIAALESRVEEQDVALRRILSLLVDWVEGGNSATPQLLDTRRNNAA